MLPERYRWIIEQFEPEGDPWQLFQIAQDLESAGEPGGAASVYDRAFGIDPSVVSIREARSRLLDRLAVVEHGLRFRYIPAGPFLMGSRDGDMDEQPVHPVWLDEYWLMETPICWEDYCRLMGWQPPPDGRPEQEQDEEDIFSIHERNKIILQYCEDQTTDAGDWHVHLPPDYTTSAFEFEQALSRTDPEAAMTWRTKPMVAVYWHEGEQVAKRLSAKRFGLPSEAQWEKAARGGLIGARYPWGDEPPTPEVCDFGHYHASFLRPSKSLPPNGYGLYGMCGGVWEWTQDWYDREAYRESKDQQPRGPKKGKEKVLRGGSWADCAEAVTVSFRHAQGPREAHWQSNCSPMIGLRLLRRS